MHETWAFNYFSALQASSAEYKCRDTHYTYYAMHYQLSPKKKKKKAVQWLALLPCTRKVLGSSLPVEQGLSVWLL